VSQPPKPASCRVPEIVRKKEQLQANARFYGIFWLEIIILLYNLKYLIILEGE
jgi:hypothetical protein